MQVIEMFSQAEMEASMLTINEKINLATKAITQVLEEGRPLVVSFSSGKDSSSLANLSLNAAMQFTLRGGSPMVLVQTADTLVENPSVAQHYGAEHRKMEAFSEMHGFKLITQVARPNLASTFQVKILSGRGIPSFAGGSGDCSVDLKTQNLMSFRARVFRDLASENLPEAVTVIGTRYDESAVRAMRMKVRGDRPDQAVMNKDGALVLCPIAMWSEDDVWEYIGLCSSGLLKSYSDFSEMRRIYGASMGTSCAVVADALYEGTKRPKSAGCGARLGCWTCLKAEDKSLANMIEFDPRYEYARGLNKLNKFLRATRWDWSRRHWVGRTIRDGWIAIQPDTYHPTMIRELFRYMLQLDKDEQDRARRAGERRMFEILPLEMIIAIDALQSLNGLARPFQCWADFRDVHYRNVRYDIPDVEPTPMSTIPDAKFLFVGKEWDTASHGTTWAGLRDPFMEAMTADSPCAPAMRPNKNGDLIWKMETGSTFGIDFESACMIEEFEMDRILEKYDRGNFISGVTEAYKWYSQYGVLELAHSQNLEHDEFCRRTDHKERLGLTLDYDVADLLARAVDFSDLPESARKAWGFKATSSSAQTDFWSTTSRGTLESQTD